MGEASRVVPPEDQVTDETNGPPHPDAAEAGDGARLTGIERDLDTADAALAALDSDDLEAAEALAAQLEGSTVDPAAGQDQQSRHRG